MKNKTAIDRTRKEGREQTNYRRNKRESSSAHRLLTETSEISVLHFPSHIFFFRIFFKHQRWQFWSWCCLLLVMRLWSAKSSVQDACGPLLQTGIKPAGLLNQQQVRVRAAGGSVSPPSNLCTSAYWTVNCISAVMLKQSVSGFNN